MKKNFKLPVVAALTVALTAPAMANTMYPDVVEGSWYTAAIESAVSNKLLSGYEDGTMKPGNSITRAEIASVMSKAFGATENGRVDMFSDVEYDQWFYDAMAKAVHMEIFTGDNNQKLNPNNPITREETAIVVAKAFELEYSGEDVLANFADKDEVSTWALNYISALVENGYMAGDDNGKLNPKGNITRAEFAQIMHNITNDYITEKATLTESYEGNVVVRATDVVMKELTVDGDLVIADGVGRGDFTLDNVTVTGNLVIRGGGVNSIHFKNGAKVKGKIFTRNHGGRTRISADKNSPIDELVINTAVIIDAECAKATVNSSANVEVTGKVSEMDVNAEDVKITGKGKIETVNANANDIKVDVKGTEVVAAEGVTGVKAGTTTVKAGSTETVKTTSSSGGSSSSSGSKEESTAVTLEYNITKNADLDIYEIEIIKDGTISNFDKEYNVTITGVLGNYENRTIKGGSDLIDLALEMLDNENFNMKTFLSTVDNRGFNSSENSDYEIYKTLAQPVLEDILGDEYVAFQNAKKQAIDDVIAKNSDLTEAEAERLVKLVDVLAIYEEQFGDATAKAKELLNRVETKNKVAEYTDVLLQFVGLDGFIDLILTTK